MLSAIPPVERWWKNLANGRCRSRCWQSPWRFRWPRSFKHLEILEKSGLVQTEKVGRVRTCSIKTAGLSVAEQWLDERRTTWEERFDRLGDLLAEPDEN